MLRFPVVAKEASELRGRGRGAACVVATEVAKLRGGGGGDAPPTRCVETNVKKVGGEVVMVHFLRHKYTSTPVHKVVRVVPR